MSEVHIMTDSIASLTQETAAAHNISIIPAAHIVYGDKLYPDGIGLTAAQAYEYINRDPDKFSTTTLSPSDFTGYYKEASRKSNNIVHLGFSSALSGTYKLAVIAAQEFCKATPGVNVQVIDSKTAACPLGLLAITASKAAASGMDIDGVIDVINRARPKTGGIMMLDTLRYVYRTGRMSKTAARLVSMLNIKPINIIKDDGTLELVERTRKREDGYIKIIEYIKRETGTNALNFIVAHGDAPQMGERMCELLRQNFDCLSLAMTEYSPIMGYSSGPGCIFVGYQPELDF